MSLKIETQIRKRQFLEKKTFAKYDSKSKKTNIKLAKPFRNYITKDLQFLYVKVDFSKMNNPLEIWAGIIHRWLTKKTNKKNGKQLLTI